MKLKSSGMADKAGLPPGTPVAVGGDQGGAVSVTMMRFGPESFAETQLSQAPKELASEGLVSWLNVDGLGDGEMIGRIGAEMGLHPLVLEDILNTGQRPKFEDQGTYLFFGFKMLRWDPEAVRIFEEHVTVIAGDGYVVSFQEAPGDVFDSIRDRIRKDKGRVRRAGSDYMAYCLLDAIVDEYFVVLEKLEDAIEGLEDDLLNRPEKVGLDQIHYMRKETILLRRALWPLRELIASLDRSDSPLLKDDTRPFLRDLYDHIIQAFDVSESLRDIAGSMVEVYLSSVNNRMSSVMKVLTLIATIFIPLTFVAGLYGMNFRYMPELEWRWGYPTIGAIMLSIGIGMVVFFRRRKWI